MSQASESYRAIAASYASCRRLAQRARSSFYPCFRLLSPPQREAMEALYAFLRHSDDLGDSAEPVDARRRALARWRDALASALAMGGTGGLPASAPPSTHDPCLDLLPALADAVRRFAIPPEHLFAVLDGVAMDLEGRRYETFDQLAEYCHRVASAVGMACLHIWGFGGDGAFGPARKCGLAFQLTNILRDLKEDALRGRLYLPAADLRQCGYAPDESVALPPDVFLRFGPDARFDQLMRLEIDRARQLYRQGAELFDWLPPAGRRVFGMMTSLYGGLLRRIEAAPRRVLEGRVRLGRLRKLAIAARWTLVPPRRPSLP
jgi:phytoene synthase